MTFVEQLILTILPIIVTSIATFYLGRITRKENEKSKKQEETEMNIELLKQAVVELLRVQLIEYHDKYIELGSIPSYSLDNFVKMYNTYKGLGETDFIAELYREVTQLPITNKGVKK